MKENKTIHQQLREHFESTYYSFTEMDYYWTVKDATNLKQLITKLEFHIKKKQALTDEKILESFQIIVYSIANIPQLKWHKETFSIANINSKLNEIISIIKTHGIKKDRTANITRIIESEIQQRSVGYNQQRKSTNI